MAVESAVEAEPFSLRSKGTDDVHLSVRSCTRPVSSSVLRRSLVLSELLAALDESSTDEVTAHAPAGFLSAWLQVGCAEEATISTMDACMLSTGLKVRLEYIEGTRVAA